MKADLEPLLNPAFVGRIDLAEPYSEVLHFGAHADPTQLRLADLDRAAVVSERGVQDISDIQYALQLEMLGDQEIWQPAQRLIQYGAALFEATDLQITGEAAEFLLNRELTTDDRIAWAQGVGRDLVRLGIATATMAAEVNGHSFADRRFTSFSNATVAGRPSNMSFLDHAVAVAGPDESIEFVLVGGHSAKHTRITSVHKPEQKQADIKLAGASFRLDDAGQMIARQYRERWPHNLLHAHSDPIVTENSPY